VEAPQSDVQGHRYPLEEGQSSPLAKKWNCKRISGSKEEEWWVEIANKIRELDNFSKQQAESTWR
jgi:hypothetical protein